jgi:hypothetical protein
MSDLLERKNMEGKGRGLFEDVNSREGTEENHGRYQCFIQNYWVFGLCPSSRF